MSLTLLYVSSFFFGGSESAREREPVGVCAYDYSANRKHASIAGFRFGAGAGPLAPIGVTSTRGLQPRGFAIDPSGRFLVAGNEHSDSLVCFRIDGDSGELRYTGHEAPIRRPACLRFPDLGA